MNKLIKNEKGLTLLEVILSFAILTIVITSFLALFPQVAKFNQKTDESFTAINLANEKLAIIEQIAKKSSKEMDVTKKIFVIGSANQLEMKSLSKDNTNFSKLNLTQNISNQTNEYIMNTQDGNYATKITITKAPDTQTTSVIHLYRVFIEVQSSEGSKKTELYGYVPVPK
jgi:Tfp pilus assembly protein PilV